MPKDTKSLDNNKAPACESRGFVHKKKEGVHFDTPSPIQIVIRKLSSEDSTGSISVTPTAPGCNGNRLASTSPASGIRRSSIASPSCCRL